MAQESKKLKKLEGYLERLLPNNYVFSAGTLQHLGVYYTDSPGYKDKDYEKLLSPIVKEFEKAEVVGNKYFLTSFLVQHNELAVRLNITDNELTLHKRMSIERSFVEVSRCEFDLNSMTIPVIRNPTH